MGLKEVLQEHKVPLPDDFDERFDIVISALRNKPDVDEKLKAYRSRGGAEVSAPPMKTDKNDFLTPSVKWFLETMTSPAARTVLQSLFAVIFIVSYLESIPVFGSILSTALDVMTAGTKSLVKTIQKALPPLFGLIPLPFMSLIGMSLASIFGLVVWPIVAMVSFSRQDFAAAVDSSIRVIPPPIGDAIADSFLEVNRMAGRINEKRIKLANDISSALGSIATAATGVSTSVKEGAQTLATKTQEAAIDTAAKISAAKDRASEVKLPSVTTPTIAETKLPTGVMEELKPVFTESVPASKVVERKSFEPVPVRKGGKKLSRKTPMKSKWKTRRNKYVKR